MFHMRHWFWGLSSAFVFLFSSSVAATGSGDHWRNRTLRVMTQNLFIGADLDIILNPEPPNEFPIPVRAGIFLAEIEQSNFPKRARAFARQVRRERPDVIGVQEATWIRRGPGDFLAGKFAPNAEETVIDFLEVLMAELKARGLRYRIAVAQRNADIELPVFDLSGNYVGDFRVTDQDAILVRHGMAASNARTGIYNRQRKLEFDLNGTILSLPIVRGYVTVDVVANGKKHRITNTHFENKGKDPTIQADQAADLVSELNSTNLPTISLGDFNDGPDDTNPSFECPATPSAPILPYEQFVCTAGFRDAWVERTNYHATSDDPGYTCCRNERLDNPDSTLEKRYDLILYRAEKADSWRAHTRIIGRRPIDDARPVWISDHAGLAARLRTRR